MQEKHVFHTLACLLFVSLITGLCLNSAPLKGQEYAHSSGADSLFARGLEFYSLGQYARAATILNELIENFSKDERLTIFKFLRGKALYYADSLTESEAIFAKFPRSYPTSSYLPACAYFLGRIYYQRREYNRAAESFLAALRRAEDKSQGEVYRQNFLAVVKGGIGSDSAYALLNQISDYSLALEVAKSVIEKFYRERRYNQAHEVLKEFLLKYSEAAHEEKLAAWKAKLELLSSGKALLTLFAPLSGEWAKYGRMMANAYELAIDQYLSDPTVLLEHSTFDTYGNAITTAIGGRQLAAQPVSAVIGPLSSDEAVSLAAYTDIANIPLICPTASDQGLTSISDMLFQLSPTPARMGEALAEFAITELGIKQVAVLAPSDNYGKQIADGFVRRMNDSGATITYQKFYPRGSTDFRRFLLDLKRTVLPKTVVADIFLDENGDTVELEALPVQVQALFLPSYASELTLILPQLRFYKIGTMLLGSDSYGETDVIKMPECQDYSIFFASKSLSLPEDTNWIKFSYFYQKKFKEPPDHIAALTYDAVNLVVDCIRQGFGDGEDIKRCLLKMSVYEGASGKIRFDQGRENFLVPIYLLSEGKVTKIE